ncbi:MAG TPA: DUF1697 domain-containing protein [Xanthobacteraceae bacterium]|nr:DUF1697 domain-containing protein [Xanthobacteraceae bacterium]
MTVHIALLRGVNLGGRTQVAMSDLRDLLTDLGFAQVRSVLNSGNLVFSGGRKTGAALETLLESEAEKRLGLRTDFHVRTAKEWATVVAKNPFREEAKRAPGHLVAMILKKAPTAKAVATLRAAITGPEMIEAVGRHAYIVYPAGIGRSRLTSNLIDSKLDTRGTGRNWNTVLKLAELVQA